MCRRIQFCDGETCILVHTLILLLPLWAQRLSARYCLLTLTRRSGWDLDHRHLVDDWASTRVGIASRRLGPVRFSCQNTGFLNRNVWPKSGIVIRPNFRPQNDDEPSVTTPSVTVRWSTDVYRHAVLHSRPEWFPTCQNTPL